MISAILAFLAAIPGIGSLVTGITSALFNAKVQITQAQIGGDVAKAQDITAQAAVESKARVSTLQIAAGSKVLVWVFALFLVPPGLYRAKIYVVDKLIGAGCVWWTNWCWVGDTDPLGNGDVGASDHIIISFMFGSATALALGQMWFSKKSQ